MCADDRDHCRPGERVPDVWSLTCGGGPSSLRGRHDGQDLRPADGRVVRERPRPTEAKPRRRARCPARTRSQTERRTSRPWQGNGGHRRHEATDAHHCTSMRTRPARYPSDPRWSRSSAHATSPPDHTVRPAQPRTFQPSPRPAVAPVLRLISQAAWVAPRRMYRSSPNTAEIWICQPRAWT